VDEHDPERRRTTEIGHVRDASTDVVRGVPAPLFVVEAVRRPTGENGHVDVRRDCRRLPRELSVVQPLERPASSVRILKPGLRGADGGAYVLLGSGVRRLPPTFEIEHCGGTGRSQEQHDREESGEGDLVHWSYIGRSPGRE